VIGP